MRAFEGYQKGVNLGGWLSQCVSTEQVHFDTFIQETDIEKIAGWGLDHVRVPVDYTLLEEEDGTDKEEGYVYLDNCVAWTRKHGLNMMIDLHKTYGYSFDPLDNGDLEIFFHSPDLQERFFAIWRKLAKRYGQYGDTVSFELLNEIVSPNVVNEWNDIANRCIEAIREFAPDTYIIYGGVNYNCVASVPLLSKPYDDKVVYNFHCYDPLVFTHQKAYWVAGMTEEFEMAYPDTLEKYKEVSKQFSENLVAAFEVPGITEIGPKFFEQIFAPATEAAEKMNVPLYCGEYGVIDRAPLPDTVNWFRDINAAFRKYGIGRAVWNYKNKDFGLVDPHYEPIQEELMKCL